MVHPFPGTQKVAAAACGPRDRGAAGALPAALCEGTLCACGAGSLNHGGCLQVSAVPGYRLGRCAA